MCIRDSIIPTMTICLLFREQISPGLAGLLLTYCFSIDGNLMGMTSVLNLFAARLVSFERCAAFADITPEREFITKADVKNFSLRWPEKGNISFKDLSLRYRPGLPLVLKNLTLSVLGGQKIGIVGRTGAGKSSIILSLLRIVEPESGYIEIDDVNTSEIGLRDLRSNITIIPQDSYIFEGTLKQNLDPLGQFSDMQLWDALDRVNLKDQFINKGGLTCFLSENGESLSVGEKQLLCIARAILKKSRIILLDEATSNIDVVTEKLIQSSIREQFRDKTVITIAHRLNTIIDSDKILVLHQGKIMEFDSPENLLKNENSYFYKLWNESSAQEM
eukprot:TRINITY_DN5228_c0_g1_i4.p1 TRINITY_DN5228_c0_g1~~TRINITY_DN5228_c0_g1_i4.p1  ORF type:complete len:332 (+),score=24.68 TRINITY_DN5228_c0_g1_i4:66-1061(+)